MTTADWQYAGERAKAGFRIFGDRLAEMDAEDRRRLQDELLDAAIAEAEILVIDRDLPTVLVQA